MTLPQVPIPPLKPMMQCPFCGHSRIIFGHDTQPKYTLPIGKEPESHYFMFCNNCRAQGPAFTNDHPDNMPFDEWNVRIKAGTCQDCRWWGHGSIPRIGFCKHPSAPLDKCGPDFGCIHHEKKEARDES